VARRRPEHLTLLVAALAAAVWIAAAAQAAAASTAAASTAAGALPITVTPVAPGGARAPGYLVVRARRGGVADAGGVVVANRSRRTVTVLLDPLSAFTARNLGFAYGPRAAPVRGSARWTVLGARRVGLRPGERRAVRVAVRPPRDAPPGEHLSAVGVQVLQAPRVSEVEGNVAVASVRRYAVGVLTKVPGPRRAGLALADARVERAPAGLTFGARARSSGTVVLRRVRGSVVVTKGARRVLRRRIGPGTLVRGTTAELAVTASEERPRVGDVYRVRVVLRHRGGTARLDRRLRIGKRAVEAEEAYRPPREQQGPGARQWPLLVLGLVLGGLVAALARRRRPV